MMGIEVPQLGSAEVPHERYALEALELLRTKCVAKKVEFFIEQKPHYGRVLFEGDDLAEQLLLNGFAKVVTQKGV